MYDTVLYCPVLPCFGVSTSIALTILLSRFIRRSSSLHCSPIEGGKAWCLLSGDDTLLPICHAKQMGAGGQYLLKIFVFTFTFTLVCNKNGQARLSKKVTIVTAKFSLLLLTSPRRALPGFWRKIVCIDEAQEWTSYWYVIGRDKSHRISRRASYTFIYL